MSNKVQDQFKDQFGGALETYDEAAVRMEKEESNGGSKIATVKMDKDGEYRFRFIVLHPDSKTKGFSFPFSQFWMKIEVPGKDKPRNVKAFRATANGFEKDPILMYRKMVEDKLDTMIKDAKGKRKTELEDLKENIKKGSYKNEMSLKFDNKHASYVLDIEDSKTRKEGWKSLELSYSQNSDLKKAVKKRWDKLFKKNPDQLCPISSPWSASPVDVDKANTNGQTKYTFTLDTDEDDKLSEKEIEAFFAAEKLENAYSGYERYHFQATKLFLEQYDAKYGLGVYETEAFQGVLSEVEAQIPADDASEFKLDGGSDSNDGSDEGGDESVVEALKFEELSDEYDDLCDSDIQDGDDEMNDFREKLREYIKQEGLSIRVGKRAKTEDIMDQLEDNFSDNGERGVAASGDEAGDEVKPEVEAEPEQEPEVESEPEAEKETERSERKTRERRSSSRPRRKRD